MNNYTFGHNLIKSLGKNSFHLDQEKVEDDTDNYFSLKSNSNFIPNSFQEKKKLSDSKNKELFELEAKQIKLEQQINKFKEYIEDNTQIYESCIDALKNQIYEIKDENKNLEQTGQVLFTPKINREKFKQEENKGCISNTTNYQKITVKLDSLDTKVDIK